MSKRKARNSGQTISTHEMQFQFERVLEAVKTGRTLTLTYRNRLLARIVPLREKPDLPADNPIYHLDELSEPVGPLTNAGIDAAIYGR